jgi:hypothetical protein
MNNYRKKVETKLKRKLTSKEIIHYKDANQHNNKNNNFQITTRKQHPKLKKRDFKLKSQDYINMLEKLEIGTIDSFKHALHIIFTNRQIEIIYRRLNKLSLSKTEREMFSRSIKKKLIALSNEALFKISQSLIY